MRGGSLGRVAAVVLAVALMSTSALAVEDIRLWHAMRGAHGVALEALVARFNSSQKDVRVLPVYKGSYEQTLREGLAASGKADGPDLLQVYEVGAADMIAARDAVRPLWRLMVEVGQPLDHGKFVPAIAAFNGDAQGRMLALPFNVSTPVMLYNRDAFRRAGLDPDAPPKTWYEMRTALGAMVDKQVECPMTTSWPSWVLIENMGAWHNQPFASHDNGLGGVKARLEFNTRLMVRWVSMLASWHKGGYFVWSGRENAAEARFASGECVVLLASSSAYDDLKSSVKFDRGVAQFPHYDDFPEAPQNTLIGGGALWAMGGKSRETYRGVARFVTWLSLPETQVAWHGATGYLPVTRAGYERAKADGLYQKLPGHEIAIKQLLLRNPQKESKGIRIGHFLQVREIIHQELEAVWENGKAPLDALNAAVQRGNELLEQFERANAPAVEPAARAPARPMPRKAK